MPRQLSNLLLFVGVWLLVLERLWLAIAFAFHDARFLLFQRARVRKRIAELVLEHGAVSGARAAG